MTSSKTLFVLYALSFISWTLFCVFVVTTVRNKNFSNNDKNSQRKASLRQQECKVETTDGFIRGSIITFEDTQVCEFLGIPYASPPVGNYRFAKPARVRRWTKTLEATSFRPSCMQVFPNWAKHMMRPTTSAMSENCLYLNIWTTSSSLTSDLELKPIVFWIHGGGYQFGSGTLDETNGTVLSALQDIIVITINYRLNAFGFLNLENEEVPGNMGLYDQAMALQWVYDNAASFGGDSSRITVWGQGMGSISVSALIVSPLTRNLIERAVMMTGSIFSTRVMYSRFPEVAEEFLSHTGCLPDEKEDVDHDSELEEKDDHQSGVISCLRRLPSNDLMKAASLVNQVNPTSFMFSPQESFFNHSSPDVIRQDLRSFLSHRLTDLMIGFNSDEGSLLLNSLDPNTFPDGEESLPEIASGREAIDFLQDLFVNRLQVSKSIIKTGLDAEFASLLVSSTNSSEERSGTGLPVDEDTKTRTIVKTMIDFVGNNIFVCPTIVFGEDVASLESGPTVHAFHFKDRSSYNQLPAWFGTIHNEEVPIMFGYPLRFPSNFTWKEQKFSCSLMTTISNFVKTGSASFQSKSWPSFTANDAKFLQLSYSGSSVKTGIHSKSCSLFKIALDIA